MLGGVGGVPEQSGPLSRSIVCDSAQLLFVSIGANPPLQFRSASIATTVKQLP